MAITIDKMRERIVEQKLHDSEYLGFSTSGTIYWIAGAEEWLLLCCDEQGQKFWSFDSLEDHIQDISDEDIVEFYNDENIADYYEDDEEMANA